MAAESISRGPGPDVRDVLLARALTYPGAWEDHPWGETVAKVGRKVFVFCGGADPEDPVVTVKLGDAHEQAIALGAEPSRYGLGRAGWVTIRCATTPVDLLDDWVDESYRLVAPKRLVAVLDEQAASR